MTALHAMGRPLVERYKGYTLECSSHRVAEGRYLAQVTISTQSDTVTLTQTAWSELSQVHRTHADACRWALDAARAWVDATRTL